MTKVTLELPAEAVRKILADPEGFLRFARAHGFDNLVGVMATPPQSRTEFGYSRTVCACPDCTINCSFIPGYLVPDDLVRIAEKVGANGVLDFAERYLLASPGATIGCSATGQTRQIRTLVPARHGNGRCCFLKGDSCAIHDVSPFGCAFFDSHQTTEDANERSLEGLAAIDEEWGRGPGESVYATIWEILFEAGRVAPAPMLARARMKAAMAIAANDDKPTD